MHIKDSIKRMIMPDEKLESICAEFKNIKTMARAAGSLIASSTLDGAQPTPEEVHKAVEKLNDALASARSLSENLTSKRHASMETLPNSINLADADDKHLGTANLVLTRSNELVLWTSEEKHKVVKTHYRQKNTSQKMKKHTSSESTGEETDRAPLMEEKEEKKQKQGRRFGR